MKMVNPGPLCLVLLAFGVCTNAQGTFYPFGSAAGDTVMAENFQRILLLQPFPYFSVMLPNIEIYRDGVLEYPDINAVGPINYVNVLQHSMYDGGNVSYQQYNTSGDVLHTATTDINSYFPDVTFHASWVFVATWDRMNTPTLGESTFQAVLVSDGDLSFLFMNYGDISPQPTMMIGYYSVSKVSYVSPLNDCYPNGEIDFVNLNTSGNTNVPGRWVIPLSSEFNFSCMFAGPDPPTVTPQPQPAYIGNVICSESFMAIEVNKTQSEQIRIHEDHLRLNDPSCTLYSNGTHVFANMSLNTCGTVMEEDATDVIFKNEIVSVDGPNDIITRHHLFKIEFFCKYPKESNVVLEFNVHKAPFTFIQKGFGTFSYQFEFFQSSQFQKMQDPSSYPLEFDLGEMMYIQIEGISPVNNTELFVESCKASPSDDPSAHVSYSIISDGCNQDETVTFYSSHANIARFGMKTFKFIGSYDQVFITCSVILCEAGNPNTRCSEGCSNTTAAPGKHHQAKREASDVPIQTLRHYISQGPLRLRRSTNAVRDAASTVTSDGLNMNLVFVAGCLLAAVGMLCGVLLYTKRPKVVYQPLPSFDGE